jgi:hypothetical protein
MQGTKPTAVDAAHRAQTPQENLVANLERIVPRDGKIETRRHSDEKDLYETVVVLVSTWLHSARHDMPAPSAPSAQRHGAKLLSSSQLASARPADTPAVSAKASSAPAPGPVSVAGKSREVAHVAQQAVSALRKAAPSDTAVLRTAVRATGSVQSAAGETAARRPGNDDAVRAAAQDNRLAQALRETAGHEAAGRTSAQPEDAPARTLPATVREARAQREEPHGTELKYAFASWGGNDTVTVNLRGTSAGRFAHLVANTPRAREALINQLSGLQGVSGARVDLHAIAAIGDEQEHQGQRRQQRNHQNGEQT